MTIGLWDMDTPFELRIDTNLHGKDFIGVKEGGKGADVITLEADQAREWARALNFLADELERKSNN